jgi:hypothetical protein
MKTLPLMMVAALLASAACNKPKEEPADSHGGMTMDSGRMEGAPGMGKSGMMPAHMDSMMRMNPERMSAMMSSHERRGPGTQLQLTGSPRPWPRGMEMALDFSRIPTP